eukprot:SAG31_NODE_20872_length_563_cov_1.997845_1_plen_124_part_10
MDFFTDFGVPFAFDFDGVDFALDFDFGAGGDGDRASAFEALALPLGAGSALAARSALDGLPLFLAGDGEGDFAREMSFCFFADCFACFSNLRSAASASTDAAVSAGSWYSGSFGIGNGNGFGVS